MLTDYSHGDVSGVVGRNLGSMKTPDAAPALDSASNSQNKTKSHVANSSANPSSNTGANAAATLTSSLSASGRSGGLPLSGLSRRDQKTSSSSSGTSQKQGKNQQQQQQQQQQNQAKLQTNESAPLQSQMPPKQQQQQRQGRNVSDAAPGFRSRGFEIDSEIAHASQSSGATSMPNNKKRKNNEKRSLAKWEADPSVPVDPSQRAILEMPLESGGSAGYGNTRWDQFKENKELFGIDVAQFNEDLFTTKVDRKSAFYQSRESDARRLAQQIENSYSKNVHIREERNQMPQRDHDDDVADSSGANAFNEEARYSSVSGKQNNRSEFLLRRRQHSSTTQDSSSSKRSADATQSDSLSNQTKRGTPSLEWRKGSSDSSSSNSNNSRSSRPRTNASGISSSGSTITDAKFQSQSAARNNRNVLAPKNTGLAVPQMQKLPAKPQQNLNLQLPQLPAQQRSQQQLQQNTRVPVHKQQQHQQQKQPQPQPQLQPQRFQKINLPQNTRKTIQRDNGSNELSISGQQNYGVMCGRHSHHASPNREELDVMDSPKSAHICLVSGSPPPRGYLDSRAFGKASYRGRASAESLGVLKFDPENLQNGKVMGPFTSPMEFKSGDGLLTPIYGNLHTNTSRIQAESVATREAVLKVSSGYREEVANQKKRHKRSGSASTGAYRSNSSLYDGFQYATDTENTEVFVSPKRLSQQVARMPQFMAFRWISGAFQGATMQLVIMPPASGARKSGSKDSVYKEMNQMLRQQRQQEIASLRNFKGDLEGKVPWLSKLPRRVPSRPPGMLQLPYNKQRQPSQKDAASTVATGKIKEPLSLESTTEKVQRQKSLNLNAPAFVPTTSFVSQSSRGQLQRVDQGLTSAVSEGSKMTPNDSAHRASTGSHAPERSSAVRAQTELKINVTSPALPLPASAYGRRSQLGFHVSVVKSGEQTLKHSFSNLFAQPKCLFDGLPDLTAFDPPRDQGNMAKKLLDFEVDVTWPSRHPELSFKALAHGKIVYTTDYPAVSAGIPVTGGSSTGVPEGGQPMANQAMMAQGQPQYFAPVNPGAEYYPGAPGMANNSNVYSDAANTMEVPFSTPITPVLPQSAAYMQQNVAPYPQYNWQPQNTMMAAPTSAPILEPAVNKVVVMQQQQIHVLNSPSMPENLHGFQQQQSHPPPIQTSQVHISGDPSARLESPRQPRLQPHALNRPVHSTQTSMSKGAQANMGYQNSSDGRQQRRAGNPAPAAGSFRPQQHHQNQNRPQKQQTGGQQYPRPNRLYRGPGFQAASTASAEEPARNRAPAART